MSPELCLVQETQATIIDFLLHDEDRELYEEAAKRAGEGAGGHGGVPA